MSWVNCTDQELCTYLRALGEGYLAISSSTTNASAPSRLITIASKSWSKGKKKGTFRGFQFSMTLGGLTESRGGESQTSSPQDSRSCVNPSPSPASEKEKTTNETSGLRPPVSFAKYDPDTSCWRTYQGSLFTNTTEKYSETWPRAGTVCGGTAYRRQPLAPLTGEIVSGSWRSPAAQDAVGRREYKDTEKMKKRWEKHQPLPCQQVKVWPTASSRDWRSGKASEETMKRNARPLNEAVVSGGTPTPQTYPTPPGGGIRKLEDKISAMQGKNPGALNPDWVEWLMQWPVGWTALTPLSADRFREWLVMSGIELTD